MRAVLSKHRTTGGGGGGGTTFNSLTSFARPTSLATTPASHQKPFTTASGLTAAINSAVPGDYIYYNGSGVLTVNQSGGSNAFTMPTFNPSGRVTIDLGTKNTTQNTAWGAPTSANYCKFAYNGTSNLFAWYMPNASNLYIYGGEFTAPNRGGGIYLPKGNNILWYDGVVHDVIGTGLKLNPATGSLTNLDFRFEVYRFGLLGAYYNDDPHTDKGTGVHGIMMADDTSGDFSNNRIVGYIHDTLAPGDSYNGVTYPEGTGGGCMQMGMPSSHTMDSNTIAFKCFNLNMRPGNGTNPGSTSVQDIGGCGILLWGTAPNTNLDILWAEASNITGNLINCGSGGWHSGGSTRKVDHGRTSSTRLYGPGNPSPNNVDYPTGFGFTYTDCL